MVSVLVQVSLKTKCIRSVGFLVRVCVCKNKLYFVLEGLGPHYMHEANRKLCNLICVCVCVCVCECVLFLRFCKTDQSKRVGVVLKSSLER